MERAAIVAVAMLGVAGCGGGSPTPSADAPTSPSASVDSSVPASASPSATETPVSAMARNDPRQLIAEEDPGTALARSLTSGLRRLQDLTVEMHATDGGVPLSLEFAIDYEGNCSIDVRAQGAAYRVVIHDGVAVETVLEGPDSADLKGRWVRLTDDNPVTRKCDNGIRGVIDGSELATGATWLLSSGRRIGMEKVRGLSALHVRQESPDGPVDVWVSVIDRTLLPVKIARGGDYPSTAYYSGFNESTVDDLPPDSQIVDPTTAGS